MSGDVMRAAVLTGPGSLTIETVARPEPGPGEIRFRVEGCGVCASNLTPWAGPDWMRYPTRPGDLGHEAWGRVDKLGEGVTGLAPGQRIAALSYNAYAEYDLVDSRHVVSLDGLPEGPFPGEPLGCAMNIFRRADIRPGDQVAIVGMGFLGLALTRLAEAAGAEVIALSRRPFALDLACTAGARHRLLIGDRGETVEQVTTLTEGRLCARVIEATGHQEPLTLAGELTAERGRLIVAGYHQDGPREVNMWLWNWRGIDVINAHERDPSIYLAGMREALEAVRSGLLDPSVLCTHALPLDRLGEALDQTRDRPDGFLKAYIVP